MDFVLSGQSMTLGAAHPRPAPKAGPRAARAALPTTPGKPLAKGRSATTTTTTTTRGAAKPAANSSPSRTPARAAAAGAAPSAKEAPPPLPSPAPAPAPAPPPDVEGENTVTYSHYHDAFPTRNGAMAWAAVDDKYCLSFVFKGSFGATLVDPAGARIARDDKGFFQGLQAGVVYALEIEADPAFPLASKPLRLTRREEPAEVRAANARSREITAALKAMSADELRAQGDDYKRLLEERELEDMLAS